MESNDNTPSSALFVVVVNDEEQHSIWPTFRGVPAGWRQVGEPRPREECLAYIEQAWPDIRPLSLRTRLADTGPPTGPA